MRYAYYSSTFCTGYIGRTASTRTYEYVPLLYSHNRPYKYSKVTVIRRLRRTGIQVRVQKVRTINSTRTHNSVLVRVPVTQYGVRTRVSTYDRTRTSPTTFSPRINTTTGIDYL